MTTLCPLVVAAEEQSYIIQRFKVSCFNRLVDKGSLTHSVH